MSPEHGTGAAASVPGSNWEWDIRSGVFRYSPEFRALLGEEAVEVSGTLPEWHERLHPDDVLPAIRAILAFLGRHQDVLRLDHRVRHATGAYIRMLSVGHAIRDDHGTTVRIQAQVTVPVPAPEPESAPPADAQPDLLPAIQSAVLHHEDPLALMRAACQVLANSNAFSAAWMGLLDDSGAFARTASTGMSALIADRLPTAETWIPIVPSPIAQALDERRPVVVAPSAESPTGWPRILDQIGSRALVVLPLLTPDPIEARPRGVLVLGVRINCELRELELAIAGRVASLLADRLAALVDSGPEAQAEPAPEPPLVPVDVYSLILRRRDVGADSPVSGSTVASQPPEPSDLAKPQADCLGRVLGALSTSGSSESGLALALAALGSGLKAQTVAIHAVVRHDEAWAIGERVGLWRDTGDAHADADLARLLPTPEILSSWFDAGTARLDGETPDACFHATGGQPDGRRPTLMCCPISAGSRSPAVLSVARVADPDWSAAERRLLSLCGQAIALARQRAGDGVSEDTAGQTAAEITQTWALALARAQTDISRAVRNEPDPDHLLRVIVGHVAGALDTAHAFVAQGDDRFGPLVLVAATGLYVEHIGRRLAIDPDLLAPTDLPRLIRAELTGLAPNEIGVLVPVLGAGAGLIGVAFPHRTEPEDAAGSLLPRFADLVSLGMQSIQPGRPVAPVIQAKAGEAPPDREQEHGSVAVVDTGDSVVDWDLRTPALFMSDSLVRALGYERAELRADFAQFVQLLHPDDLAAVAEALHSHLAGLTEGLLVEYRLLSKGGAYRWVSSRGRTFRDESGRVSRLVIAQTDVTALRQARLLLDRVRRLYSLLSRVHQLAARAPTRDELLRAACAAAVDTGLFQAAWVGLLDDTASLIVPAAAEAVGGLRQGNVWLARSEADRDADPVSLAVRTGKPLLVNDASEYVDTSWGSAVLARGARSVGAFPIVTINAIGALGVYSQEAAFFGDDETQVLSEVATALGLAMKRMEEEVHRQRAEERLRYLSYHDALTGLHNRAYFEEELRRLGGSRLYPVTIVSTDLDGVKIVNDAFGHRAGDELLAEYAQALRGAFRGSDVVARIGGDEFVAILPNTNAGVAAGLVARVAARIDQHNARGVGLPISHSLGAATAADAATPLSALHEQADRAMYADKNRRAGSGSPPVIGAMIASLADRDFGAQGHLERVDGFAVTLGLALSLDAAAMANLRLLASVHDLGNVGVPEHVLNKREPLDPADREQIQSHSTIGYRIARASGRLTRVADLILHHHEWWNGSGYPAGIRGEEIPLLCRIFAVVDAYDAMTSARPYRQPLNFERAVSEILGAAGGQFDPVVAEEFARIAKAL